MPLDEFDPYTITGPLGMKDTRFFIPPAAQRDRLAAVFMRAAATGRSCGRPEGSKGQGSTSTGRERASRAARVSLPRPATTRGSSNDPVTAAHWTELGSWRRVRSN